MYYLRANIFLFLNTSIILKIIIRNRIVALYHNYYAIIFKNILYE